MTEKRGRALSQFNKEVRLDRTEWLLEDWKVNAMSALVQAVVDGQVILVYFDDLGRRPSVRVHVRKFGFLVVVDFLERGKKANSKL